jgi:hypothetical protein
MSSVFSSENTDIGLMPEILPLFGFINCNNLNDVRTYYFGRQFLNFLRLHTSLGRKIKSQVVS